MQRLRKFPLQLTWVIVCIAASVPAYGQQTAVISVKLESTRKKSPVVGATLRLSATHSDKVFTMTSGKDGRAVRVGIRSGTYQLEIECDGYTPLHVGGIEIKDNDRLQLTFPLEPRP